MGDEPPIPGEDGARRLALCEEDGRGLSELPVDGLLPGSP